MSSKAAILASAPEHSSYLEEHKVQEQLRDAVTKCSRPNPPIPSRYASRMMGHLPPSLHLADTHSCSHVQAIAATLTKQAVAAAITTGYTFLTIQPTFTVKDWEAAKPIMEEFVERTKTETGCLYYGWSRCGDKLFCREAYSDAAGVLAHLDNVGPLVGKLLESAATLDQIELHGPAAELDKCKANMDAFGTTYWEIDSGFQTFE